MSVSVCVRKGCRRGCMGKPSRKCPYEILHALETEPDFAEMPRRSGKTTKMKELALELAGLGQVFFIVQNAWVGQHIWPIRHPNVKVLSWRQVLNGRMRGYDRGFVVMDELRPEHEMAEIMPELRGHDVVAARWTNW